MMKVTKDIRDFTVKRRNSGTESPRFARQCQIVSRQRQL